MALVIFIIEILSTTIWVSVSELDFQVWSSHLDVEIIGFVFFHVLKGFMVSTRNFTPGFKRNSIHTIPLMVEEKDYV